VTRVGFLGFGEAGSSIAAGLGAGGITGIVAFDIAWGTSEVMRERALGTRTEMLDSPADLAERADVIISAVVCSEAERAARSIAEHLGPSHWYLDINSVSAGVKTAIAGLLEPRGVAYVDVAVMSNVSSDLARLPLLAAGPRAADVPDLFPGVALDYTTVSDRAGEAARIKMFRSLFVKGLEALALESMMACWATGVSDQVLASLEGTFGKYTFPELVHHLIERHAVHGARRAAELEEVATSIAEAGVEPIMAEAGHRRMSWDVERGLQARFQAGTDPDWRTVLAELERLRMDEAPS